MILSVFTWDYDSEPAWLGSGRRAKVFFTATILLMSCVVPTVLASSEAMRGIMADDLLAIRDIKTIAVSPDGKHVAYEVVRADKELNDYDISWYVAATRENAAPVLVADGGEAALSVRHTGHQVGDLALSEIVWSSDSEWIYFTKKHASAVQIWRSHRSRYGQRQITRNAADVEGPKFSEDGSKLFFAVGRTRADIKTIFEKEARQGHLMQEYANSIYSVENGSYLPNCSDGQERWIHYTNKKWSCTLTVWAVDIHSGIERKATADETDAYFAKPDSSLNALVRQGTLKDQPRSMETTSPDGKSSAWFENEDPTIYKGPGPLMRVAAFDGEKTLRCPDSLCRSVRPQKI